MGKDPKDCIKNYQKHLHLAIQELTKLFSDKDIQDLTSQELQSRAARIYVCLMDIGKIASLKEGKHLQKLAIMIEEYLDKIPMTEKTEVEFGAVLAKLEAENDKNIILDGGNC